MVVSSSQKQDATRWQSLKQWFSQGVQEQAGRADRSIHNWYRLGKSNISRTWTILRIALYRGVVAWVGFWTIYFYILLGGGIGIASIRVLESHVPSPLDLLILFIVLIPIVGFISLTAVTYLRILVWLRNFSEWLWNRWTPPYESEPYYKTAGDPAESLDEVRRRALRQGKWASFLTAGTILSALIYDSTESAKFEAFRNLLPIEIAVNVLLNLFFPLAVTTATLQDAFANESEETMIFFALLVGVPAIPFAFPIRNALYWTEQVVKKQLRNFTATSLIGADVLFIFWCLLVTIAGPVSFWYVISEVNL